MDSEKELLTRLIKRSAQEVTEKFYNFMPEARQLWTKNYPKWKEQYEEKPQRL